MTSSSGWHHGSTHRIRYTLALGVETGDRVEFIELEPGHYEIVAATLPVTALKGIVPKPDQPVSIDDMDTAIIGHADKAVDE
ncbi:MAG: AbrB family transcriptional regulator [Salinisphaeraceae bacterium]|nr:AbrB family transcriptional regulator [Salinisphaeraceae bacterium]